MSSKTKMIAVSEKTWKYLQQRGTLADTFDTVIQKLIDRENVAIARSTLAGSTETTTTLPQQTSNEGDCYDKG